MIEKIKSYWPFVLVIIIILVIFGLVYFRYFKQSQNLSKPVIDNDLTPLSLQGQITSASSDKERITVLEQAVLDLAKQVGELKLQIQGSSTTVLPNSQVNSSPESLSSLTAAVTTLQTEVNQLKASNGGGNSNNQGPIYIPLGWNGSSNTIGWTGIPTQSFTINPSNYPGYTSVQFQANMQIYEGNGTAYAGMYNSTSGTPVNASIISTNSQNYTWVSSAPFQLSSGQNTYYLQLNTNTGYSSNVIDARLQINF